MLSKVNNGISKLVSYISLLFLFFQSISITQDWYQAGTHEKLHLNISTNWDQQPPILNATVMDMQQATLIGNSSADIIKHDTNKFQG